MEIKILHSILNDELRPWKLDTTDRRYFASRVRTANAISLVTYKDLQSQLTALLTDIPDLLKRVNEKPPDAKASLQPSLYETTFPKFSEAVTQYYSLLISQEATRIYNFSCQKIDNLSHKTDRIYHVTQTLKSIKVLAAQTASTIKELQDAADLTRFVLATLKQHLIKLFFEIQTRFEDYVSQPESEEYFFNDSLNEQYTVTQFIPTLAFFEFQIQVRIFDKTFSKDQSIKLLQEIQQQQSLQTQSLRASLENYIFLKSNDIKIVKPSIGALTKAEAVTKHLNDAKATINSEIEKHNYGHQRFSTVQRYLDDLDYVGADGNKQSIPSQLLKWLSKLSDVYQQNAAHVFSKDESSEDLLRRKGKPLSKQNEFSIDEKKVFALEHLKFMSGMNQQQIKIMSDDEFKRMMNYTYSFLETSKLPKGITPIPHTNISTEHIRYTYYIIHKQLFGKRRNKAEWVTFLHKVFKQFSNTSEQTTNTKFSVAPKSYHQDLESFKK